MMLGRARFLRVAVEMAVISEAIAEQTLKQQRLERRSRKPHRLVGTILQDNGHADKNRCDAIAERVNQLRGGFQIARLWFTPNSRVQVAQLIIAICALAAVPLIVRWSNASVADAMQYASFGAFVLFTFVCFLPDRAILRAVYRGFRMASILAAVFGLIYIVRAVVLGANTSTWLFRGLAVLLVILVISAALFFVWKDRSRRFAVARFGALKDLLITLQQTKNRADLTGRERGEQAIDSIMKALQAMITLSAWDWARRMAMLNRSSAISTSAVLLVPTEQETPRGRQQCLRVRAASYPPEAPQAAVKVLERIAAEYRPSMFDESRYQERVRVASEANPEGWQDRFPSSSDRWEFTSASGWVHTRQQILVADVAERCLVFDNSFHEDLFRNDPSAAAVMHWLRVGSFIATPVPHTNGKGCGVLFVFKNVRHGFSPDDHECLTAVAQLLSELLDRESNSTEVVH